MNTLSKQITRRFFCNAEGYDRLRARMNDLMCQDRQRAAAMRKAHKQDSGIDPATIEKPRLTAAHHVLYLILRGKDWRKAFAPVTNDTLLANGATRWRAATLAIRQLHSAWHEAELLAPFSELLAGHEESAQLPSHNRAAGIAVLNMIRRLVPLGDGYGWQADLDTAPAYADLPVEFWSEVEA
jgi:hypothetical protein